MPVRVTCPACERSINAPDRARGKAVKCPQCGTPVRVPIATKAKKKVAAPPPPSSSALIAMLDLDRLEDTQTRICPKCGAEVSFEDAECPECHVNLDTGTLSAENKAELNRKGPNPKLYYKEFVSNGIEFWKKNKSLTVRLMWLVVAFTAGSLFCVFVSLWSMKPLVRYFFEVLACVALLVPPGLAWHLHSVIIDATMRKKKKLGKYTFDTFLGASLGVKLLFWFVNVTAPFHVLAIASVLLYSHGFRFGVVVALGLEVAAVLFASLLFPIAMTHMAMPVTTRGWLVHKMLKPLGRTLPAVLFWCLFVYLTLLPPLALVAGGAYLSEKKIETLYLDSARNSKLIMFQASMEDLAKNVQLNPEQVDLAKSKPVALDFSVLLLPSAAVLCAAALFSMTAVFSMRTNGLFAHYFINQLDLESMAPEVKYVPTVASLREMAEVEPKLTWKPVIIGLVVAFAVTITVGGTIGSSYFYSFTEGAIKGMMLVGSLTAIIGLVWLFVAAIKKKNFAWEVTRFATVVLVCGLIYGGLGFVLFKTQLPPAKIPGRPALGPGEAPAEPAGKGKRKASRENTSPHRLVNRLVVDRQNA